MRMNDEEYFRSCVAKERHLAQLLGHHNIEEFYESAGTLWQDTTALPQWTRDWDACARLLTEYEIPLSFHCNAAEPHNNAVIAGPITVHFSDHPSKDHAVRYAIVKAVTTLLEHAKAHKN